jgi:PAS domain-containing protein
MSTTDKSIALDEIIPLALDCLGVAVSIISPSGELLYFNRRATEILDRKPEYIGDDVHSHHQTEAANQKLDNMLSALAGGRTEPMVYRAKPYGKAIEVTLAPILKDGVLLGCVQSVRQVEEERG